MSFLCNDCPQAQVIELHLIGPHHPPLSLFHCPPLSYIMPFSLSISFSSFLSLSILNLFYLPLFTLSFFTPPLFLCLAGECAWIADCCTQSTWPLSIWHNGFHSFCLRDRLNSISLLVFPAMARKKCCI